MPSPWAFCLRACAIAAWVYSTRGGRCRCCTCRRPRRSTTDAPVVGRRCVHWVRRLVAGLTDAACQQWPGQPRDSRCLRAGRGLVPVTRPAHWCTYNTTVTASRGRRGHGLGRGDCRCGATGDAATLRRRRHSTPHPPVVQFVPPLRRHPTATASATLRRPSSCALATQLQALRVVGGLRASWSAASGRGCLLYDTAATAAPRCCGGSSQA